MLAKANSLMEQGNFKSAINVLEPGSLENCQLQASLLLAAAFDGLGDFSAELQTLQRADTRWPGDVSVSASLARLYLGTGAVDLAAEAVRHCHVSPQTPLRELQVITNVYLKKNDLEHAGEVASAAYAGYPSEATLLLEANILQLEGRYMDVIEHLGRARAQYENSARFLITVAESEYDAQMYQAGLRDVSQGLKLDASIYAGHYVLANTLVKTGDLQGALEEYKVAIRLNPSQPRTYYRLALAQEMQQDVPAAEASLTQAIAADNHYAPAYGEMGKLLLRLNQYPQAVDQLTNAIQYNPRFEEAYFLLVQAYARLGEKDKSAAVLTQWNEIKAQKRAQPVARKQKVSVAGSSEASP